jgi:hypothetical protein
MARGESGRIVLEIDPSKKVQLYSALKSEGLTLKDWFLKQASQYLIDKYQMPLFSKSKSTMISRQKVRRDQKVEP